MKERIVRKEREVKYKMEETKVFRKTEIKQTEERKSTL